MVNPAQGSIQSVQRALRLLSTFTPEQPQWSVGELARATALHKSMVTRLMATMACEGFVLQHPVSRAYTIGPQAFSVGNVYGPLTIFGEIARPIMQDLAISSGHACALGIRADDVFTILIIIDSPPSTPVHITLKVGSRRPLHGGSIGKVLLADMSPERVREILGSGPLVKSTPFTIDSIDQLAVELDEIRRTGIAVSRQEAIVGVGSVAAGITNANGDCIAGISVVYPFHLVTEQEMAAMAQLTTKAANQISQRLCNLSFG